MERICPVGYINGKMEHALLSIENPTMTSEWGKRDMIQVVITIESAIELRAELNAFLQRHGVREQ